MIHDRELTEGLSAIRRGGVFVEERAVIAVGKPPGIRPDWWMLPSQTPAAWREISDIIEHYEPYCRGVFLLGPDVPLDELSKSFRDAANCSYCRGFVVGRPIFGEPARAWFAGHSDDETTVDRVAQNYRNIVRLWQASRTLERAAGELQ